VPSVLNERDFTDPRSRQLALGMAIDPAARIWLTPRGDETMAPQNGGMIRPMRHDLPPNTSIYRFADSRYGVEGALSGGWWMERRELDRLIRFSELNDKPISFAVRLLCCVPPEWGSRLDSLVCARTRGWLAAYRGLANSAWARDAISRTEIPARNDVAEWRLHQIFIPGLRGPGAYRRLLIFQQQWDTSKGVSWIFR
jgi:hypothetical protein